MIPVVFTELHRLQKEAVIALKPLCLETDVREAITIGYLGRTAAVVLRSLKSTRFLSTQCGSQDAARRIRALTQPAYEAVSALIAECEREIGKDLRVG